MDEIYSVPIIKGLELKVQKIIIEDDTMAGKENRRIMEMQMDALKDEHGVEIDSSKNRIPKNARSANNAKLAKLYEDAGEYEAELACFEEELDIINDNKLGDVATLLTQKFPNEERNYAQEVKDVLEAGWKNLVEVEKTHPKEQFELIKETDFCDVAEKLNATYPEYSGDFETDIRDILVKRWEFLVDIKKEHIADERAEMKLQGMKPDHIRKVYRNFHGIVD